MFAVKKFTVPEREHAVVNILKPCVCQTVPMVAVRWTNYRSCYYTGGRGRGGELKCGRELIERQSTVSTVLNGHCLSIRMQTLDRGEAKSSKLEVGIEDTMPT